jgi:hypothetical protein
MTNLPDTEYMRWLWGKYHTSNIRVTDPQTKIDALVRKRTGWSSLAQMCKNYPTLRASPGASEREKKDFALLRKAYKRVTGKEAFK